MKILNLFAGIGGNRALWGDEHEIIAVEHDPFIAELYKERFPNDIMVVGDAYQYIVGDYKYFDFIWGSPPCTTHTRLMFAKQPQFKSLPELKLFSLILFLKHHFHGKWVIENVDIYYEPLIKPQAKLGRHLFWSNFPIPTKSFTRKYTHVKSDIKRLKEEYHAEDVPLEKGMKARQILRNMVQPEIGLYILKCVNNIQLEKWL
jgi:DNA (cytosine-5)-methyltransferase 1